MNSAFVKLSAAVRSERGAQRPLATRDWLACGLGFAALCLLGLSGVGCRMTAPPPDMESSIHSTEDVAVTPQQARLRMRALVEPLSGAIVESADRISAGTTNRVVRREALLWKIEGVSALREALFRPNPFVAIMDTSGQGGVGGSGTHCGHHLPIS